MKLKDFKLERYFAKHEFTARYLLSSSDCDGYELKYLLDNAKEKEKILWHEMKLGYTESAGLPLLRESILQFYNIKTIKNVVVASPGELNYITMNLLLKPTDHIITVSPCYQSLYEIAKSLKCEISSWTPDIENWEFNTLDLEKLIKKNTRLIVINFPHNPTGSYLNLQQLNKIISIAIKHDLYILSDEMYRKLMIDDVEELPAICDLYEKGISLWGTSKSFGLAGLRTGWLVSQDTDFIQKVIAFKDYLSICNSAPSEILSIIALNNIDKFLQPNIKKIKDNIALFKEFAANQQIITSFVPPVAGSCGFVKLNIKSTSLEFSNTLVQKTGIMTVPSEMFEFEGKFIRVGFGRDFFKEVLSILDEYLKN